MSILEWTLEEFNGHEVVNGGTLVGTFLGVLVH